MKKFLLGLAVLSVVTIGACKKPKDPDPTPEPENTEIKENITADRTLKTGNTYTMEGVIYVKGGATLTIEPGVTIKAVKGKTCLVITRGSKIMAVGTASSPIVFTSAEATPGYGDWGGIVILGKATTNASFNSQAGQGEIEGGVNNSDNDGVYGGTDDDDNSGKLKYVRIEYGGYPFQPDKELNSLTMGAVGRGTEIDYVQCSYGYDDAFEWFGGTVNAKHLIAYKGLDDDFDTDFGFRGNIQFAIAFRSPSQNADISGSNGFECDNDASGSTTAPYTAPVFANVTIIGPKETSATTINTNFKRAAHLRRNSRTSILNSVIMGYPTGILIDGSKTATELLGGTTMEIKGVLVAGMNTNKGVDTTGTTSTGLAWTTLFTSTAGNSILTNTSDVMLSGAYATGASFNPAAAAGSPAASGAVTSPKLTSFFTPTTYRGAAGVGDNWWSGWAQFN